MVKTRGTEQIELRADPVTRDIVDVHDGIDRVMGKRDLYARMLLRFRSDYPHAARPLTEALANGDLALAQRTITSLKGITGMIGAHRLHRQLCLVEETLRLQQDCSAGLEQLCLEFERALQLLDVLLDGRPPEGVPVQFALRPLLGDQALLRQLEELLRSGDGAAVDLLDESATSLTVVLGAQRLERVMAAARSFNFSEALRALDDGAKP